MSPIGEARTFISTAVCAGAAVAWQLAKFSVRQTWDVLPFKGTFYKTLAVGKQALKTAGSAAGIAGTTTVVYKAAGSEYLAAGLSAAGSLLEPLAEPVTAYASAAVDSAKESAKEFVIQSLSDIASLGVSGTVHFIAGRVFSAANSIFNAFGLFFQVFKRMDTSAQIMVGGALLLRFAGPKLTKKMHTFCIGPNLPRLALYGSCCQSPLRARIEKEIKRLPAWLRGKDEIKPVLNKDIKALVEPFITANKEIAAGGDGFFKNMLFLGPPGTGKTMLAKYIARESGMNYIEIDGATLGWLEQYEPGRGLAALKDLFRYIEESGRPVLVLIDEADGLLQRSDALKDPRAKQSDIQLRSALLAATGTSNKLLLVMTTNHPEKMDRALLSRMQTKVRISPPDLDSRVEIITKYIDERFKKRPDCLNEEKIQELAEKTEGMSGRDLAFLVDSFAVVKQFSHTKTLTSEKVADILDDALRAFKEEYDYNAAQAASIPAATQPAAPLPAATEPAASIPAATQPAAPLPEVVQPQVVKSVAEVSIPEKPAVKTVQSLSQKISNYVVALFSKIKQVFSKAFLAIGRAFSFSRSKPTVQDPDQMTSVLGKK